MEEAVGNALLRPTVQVATAEGYFQVTRTYKGGNSGDVLVQNAAALFRRPLAAKRQTSSGSSEGSNPTFTSQQQLDLSSGGVGGRRNSISQNSGGSHKKQDDVILEGGESDESEIDVEIGIGVTTDTEGVESAGDGKKKRFGFRPGKIAKATNDEVKEDFETFRRFLQPRTGSHQVLLTLSCWLYYCAWYCGCCDLVSFSRESWFGSRRSVDKVTVEASSLKKPLSFIRSHYCFPFVSYLCSWFILFLVRQVITGTLAQCTQVFLIDFLSLQLRLTVRLFGTIFTLLLVQSKGWPCLVFFWGV